MEEEKDHIIEPSDIPITPTRATSINQTPPHIVDSMNNNDEDQVIISPPNIISSSNNIKKPAGKYIPLILVILSLVLIPFALHTKILFVLIVILWLGVALISFILNAKASKLSNSSAEEFAKQNGLTYNPNPANDIVSGLFNWTPETKHAVTNSNEDIFFLMSTGQESDRYSFINYSIMRVSAKRLSGKIVWLPKQLVGPNEYFNIAGLYKYSFEGDEINNSFACFLQSGFEIDALTLFSPNLLEWICTNYPKYPIILQDGYLYIFGQGVDLYSLDWGNINFDYKAVYEQVKAISDHIQKSLTK
ncbi:MAG: hypothetical protein WCI37_03240 [bacterium]|jgi:hypothetical protein